MAVRNEMDRYCLPGIARNTQHEATYDHVAALLNVNKGTIILEGAKNTAMFDDSQALPVCLSIRAVLR